MKYLLIPIGSAGDVFPYLGLAKALRSRGQEVTVLLNEYFADTAARAQTPFQVISSAADFLRVANDPRAWHPILGPQTVLSYTGQLVQPVYDAICRAGEPDELVLVSSALGWGARLAQDRHGYPLITVHLQPAVLFSAVDPPCLPGLSPKAPAWWNRFLFRMAERLFLDTVSCPALNAWRHRHGLGAIRRITDWWQSPSRIVGLFPAWFASPPPDWPPQVRLTQFPLWDDGGEGALPDDVARFLDAGDPPVVITPGSANSGDHTFWATVIAATEMLGRRAMLLARLSGQVPRDLPPHVCHVEYASFTRLLPQTAAIVHHGGIGTTARALAAGIPQVIRPFSHDQPDNARRIERLGVGASLHRPRFTSVRLAETLSHLLNDRTVAARCQEYALRIQSVDPFEATCQEIIDG